MTKFTNNTGGPKGVYTLTGLVYVNAGSTSDDLEVSEGELKSAKSTGWFTIEGQADDGEKGLDALTLPDLKKIAEDEKVELGDATKKADIIAAIELARESKAQA
jgi:hypothetical protein